MHTFTLQEKIFPTIAGKTVFRLPVLTFPTKGAVNVAGHPTPRLYHAWISSDEAGAVKVPKLEQSAQVVRLTIRAGMLAPGTQYWLHVEPVHPVSGDATAAVELALVKDTSAPAPPTERRVGKPDRRK